MITNGVWLHHFVGCSQSNAAWAVARGSAGAENTHPPFSMSMLNTYYGHEQED